MRNSSMGLNMGDCTDYYLIAPNNLFDIIQVHNWRTSHCNIGKNRGIPPRGSCWDSGS